MASDGVGDHLAHSIADALRPGVRKTRFSVDSVDMPICRRIFFFLVYFCKASMASPLDNYDEGVSLEARYLIM